MTETINGVPLELLKRAVQIPSKASVEENQAAIVDRGRAQAELRDMLPSLQAGVEVKLLGERISLLEGLLREARQHHGVMLLSDPPQHAWKFHGLDGRIDAALWPMAKEPQ
jgi:hypothetical protein